MIEGDMYGDLAPWFHLLTPPEEYAGGHSSMPRRRLDLPQPLQIVSNATTVARTPVPRTSVLLDRI